MSGGLMRTLRLVDQAFAAERAGDQEMADRLFAEVVRIGPTELTMAPEEDSSVIELQYACLFPPDGDGRGRARPGYRSSAPRTRTSPNAAGLHRTTRMAMVGTRQTRPDPTKHGVHHHRDDRLG